MTFWLVQALNGISYGMLLFLLASGLSLIFGVMKILNLTHGSFYLLGGYLGLVVLQVTGSFILAVLGASLAIALIGVVMERFFLRRFHLQQLPQVLVTFGFLFIFSDIATVIWGANPQTMPRPELFSGSLQFAGYYYPTYRLFIIGFGLFVATFLWWLQDGTLQFGKRCRMGHGRWHWTQVPMSLPQQVIAALCQSRNLLLQQK